MPKHGCDDPRCACQMEKPCCAYHAAFGGWCPLDSIAAQALKDNPKAFRLGKKSGKNLNFTARPKNDG